MNLKDMIKHQRKSGVKISNRRLVRLVPKQEADVLIKMVDGESPSQAVVSAGYEVRSPQHAAAVGKAIWDKHSDENGALVSCLESVGVTFDVLAERIKEGLSATKTRMIKRDGEWEEKAEADHGMRHKYLETAIRVRNADPPKKVEVAHQTFESKLFEIINSQSKVEDAEIINGND